MKEEKALNICITATERSVACAAPASKGATGTTRSLATTTSSSIQRQQMGGGGCAGAEDDHRRNNLSEPFLNDTGNDDPPTYETVQALIGKSGMWQLQVFLLASFSGFCTSFHNLIYGFIGAVPDHWCALPNFPLNYSRQELRQRLTSNLSAEDSKCMQHPWTWDARNFFLHVDDSAVVRCSKFEFNNSEFESTVATDWQLVCDDAAWAPCIQIMYMVGLFIGAPVFGIISDKMGRKSAILISSLIFTIAGPLIALSPNFSVLLVLRFILGFALPGVYACSYVLAIEVISEPWRSTAGNFFNLPFALGYTILPIIAYFVRSWKTLQIICSIPSLELILTWWFLPESPRWLIRKGRLEQAEKTLRHAAKINDSQENIPDNFSELIKAIYDQEKEPEAEGTFGSGCVHAFKDYLSITKSPKMRSIFLTLCFCWVTIGMTYYGLGLNSANLSTDRFRYVFIGGVLEFPAYLMVPFFIKYFGRKRVFIGFTWTCGAALLISLFLPEGSVVVILLSYLGKLVIGANYSLVYLYSSELLPTLVRNCALGVCAMMGRLGSTIAPFIVDIVGREHHMYPSLIFGCLAVIAGCMSLILPETQNRPLPETIEEVEMGNGFQMEEEKSKTSTEESTEIVVASEEGADSQ